MPTRLLLPLVQFIRKTTPTRSKTQSDIVAGHWQSECKAQ